MHQLNKYRYVNSKDENKYEFVFFGGDQCHSIQTPRDAVVVIHIHTGHHIWKSRLSILTSAGITFQSFTQTEIALQQ